MSGDISPEEQQARWLEEGKAVVKQQAFLMFSSLPLHPLCILCSHIMHPYPRAHILVHTHACTYPQKHALTHMHMNGGVSV